MPAFPNLLERALFAANAAPGLAVDLAGAGTLRALRCGVALGVFEALRAGPRTAEELARQMGADPRGLAVLLDTLARTGYVRAGGQGAYANTPQTAKWLLEDAPLRLATLVRFWSDLVFPFWDAHLEHAVRNGGPPRSFYGWLGDAPGRWELAQAWFMAGARVAGAEIVRKAALRAPERLLDLGGGHGLYAAAFAGAHPGLRAAVVDLPPALVLTPQVLREEGMADRVALREGDYLRDDLPAMGLGGQDAVLLFNVLHAHVGGEAAEVVRRAAGALRPGGVLLVLDQFPGMAPGPAVRAAVQVVGLNYLATLGGQIHPYEEVAAWVEGAGLEPPRRMALRDAPGSYLVRARKPAG